MSAEVEVEYCVTCGRLLAGVIDGPSMYDRGRCADPDGRECRAVAKASAGYRLVEEIANALAVELATPEDTRLRAVHKALGKYADEHVSLADSVREILRDLYAYRLRAERAEKKVEIQQRQLAALPTAFFEGEWRCPQAAGPEPWARVTYTDEPSPETGHVGWCWWARGAMGAAQTYEAACAAAVAHLRRIMDDSSEVAS